MKCHHIEARDIPDAWFQCVDQCYLYGRDYKVGEGSYAGSEYRRELDYVTIHILYPQTRPLLPEIPPGLGIPDPVPEGMDYLQRYLPYLMTDDKKQGEQYTYGERLFARLLCGEPDKITGLSTSMPCQVDETVAKLKRSAANNQACMTIAQPSDIHLSDPPCLRQIDCRVSPDRSGADALHFCIYFRSWDLWGGFPANLAAIVHLQEYMAAEIGINAGEFICSSKGLHLYSMYWHLAKVRCGSQRSNYKYLDHGAEPKG